MPLGTAASKHNMPRYYTLTSLQLMSERSDELICSISASGWASYDMLCSSRVRVADAVAELAIQAKDEALRRDPSARDGRRDKFMQIHRDALRISLAEDEVRMLAAGDGGLESYTAARAAGRLEWQGLSYVSFHANLMHSMLFLRAWA